ncbi:MAG: oligopeptide/dipeptide ABC transporter ATP-binding protein, partial [Gammaproteobacteria bacterium]
NLGIDPGEDLPVIPGQPPDLENLPGGCAFASRCHCPVDICRTERPTLRPVDAGHARACHRSLAEISAEGGA